MIEIRKLSTLTFDEALELWHLSFEGYIYDSKMHLDQFIQRFGNEGLMPSLSIAAYVDGKPAGLVLNGVRDVDGKKIAWNGGTGVAVKFRRQGVGMAMIRACLDIYKENDVDMATLEAAKANEPAIALYKKLGYSLIDELSFLQFEGPLQEDAFGKGGNYRVKKGVAQDALHLEFYNDQVPWQTHWQGLRKDGELLVVLDQNEAVGYFLYKRALSPKGKLSGIILFQSGIKPGRDDRQAISGFGLRAIFSPIDTDGKRMTFNYPRENKEVIRLLEEEGFKPVTEQVFMMKKLK